MIRLELVSDRPGDDLGRVTDTWPRSLMNLSNMGVREGTLIVFDGKLYFRHKDGVRLLWRTDQRQWETDWSSVNR